MSERMDAEQVKKLATETYKARLEQMFLEAWSRNFPNLPRPVMQYRFHAVRKWRFDFAWEFVGGLASIRTVKLAVEIDGGSFVQGRHSQGTGQAKDNEKHNQAVADGWRVLRFNTAQMKFPDDVVMFVAEVLTNARATA